MLSGLLGQDRQSWVPGPLLKFFVYSDVTHTHSHTHTPTHAGTHARAHARTHPHTHTRPEPGQPRKARGTEKADTNDGQKAKTAQGGREQTDLQNQPTRRNGPHQHRTHTHLNPTTHYRGARGRN